MINTIRELIQQVRETPAMYIGDFSVVKFSHFLDGFIFARDDAGDHTFSDALRGFQEKVEERYSIELSIHWSQILAFVCQSETKGLDRFWKMWDEHLSEVALPNPAPEESGP